MQRGWQRGHIATLRAQSMTVQSGMGAFVQFIDRQVLLRLIGKGAACFVKPCCGDSLIQCVAP